MRREIKNIMCIREECKLQQSGVVFFIQIEVTFISDSRKNPLALQICLAGKSLIVT
jgi:hypothetical protein